MMKIKIKYLASTFIVLCLLSVSCTEKTEKNCLGNSVAYVIANIETSSKQEFDSLKVFSSELNKVFSIVNTKKIKIPLNFNSKETSVNIGVYNKSSFTIDTINFKYKTIISAEDINCGFSGFFNIKEINFTKNVIDSIKCTNNIVNFENAENINIYM